MGGEGHEENEQDEENGEDQDDNSDDSTINDESSFLPNGSAKLTCQTHDARTRIMRMLQRFFMIYRCCK